MSEFEHDLKKLVGAKDVEVTIDLGDGKPKYLGVAQGIGINLGQTVDRLMVLGSKATLPFAGYYMSQITFRTFFMTSPSSKNDFSYSNNLQDSALPNPISNVQMTLKSGDNLLTIQISKAFWNAHSISVQAGQVLVFEDVTFECEDISFI